MHKQSKYIRITGVAVCAILLFTGGVVNADRLTVPNTFVADSPAIAASVNENFSAVKAAVDGNDAGISSNTTAISANTTAISEKTTDISDNATAISDNATTISDNATAISANTTAISDKTTAISGNATAISGNATAISANTTAISDKTTDISDNATAISDNATTISDNATAISGNATAISANTTAISDKTTDISDNATAISDNATTISDNATAISANTTAISDKTTAISGNATAISANTTAISDKTTDISDNATAISDNATAISDNATAISDNATDISDNTANISDNFSEVTSNTSDISSNTEAIGTNTTAVADHETRIAAVESAGASSAIAATAVTIDCPDEDAIQSAIDGASDLGRLVITINGTCSENVVVTRNNVTLIGGTSGAVQGATSSPSISASQISGFEIENLTIGGGSIAVLIDNGSNILVTSATLGDGTTTGDAFIAQASIARFVGGSSGNRISGGIEGYSSGIYATSSSSIIFVSGNHIINAGPDGPAIVCEAASAFMAYNVGSVPEMTVNGAIDLLENCYFGAYLGTITGDIYAAYNSTLTLATYEEDGEIQVVGEIDITRSSAAFVYGDGVTITGDVLVHKSSTADFTDGATVSGQVSVWAGSGLVADEPDSIGTLDCTSDSGSYLYIVEDTAEDYLFDGETPNSGDSACGFDFP